MTFFVAFTATVDVVFKAVEFTAAVDALRKTFATIVLFTAAFD